MELGSPSGDQGHPEDWSRDSHRLLPKRDRKGGASRLWSDLLPSTGPQTCLTTPPRRRGRTAGMGVTAQHPWVPHNPGKKARVVPDRDRAAHEPARGQRFPQHRLCALSRTALGHRLDSPVWGFLPSERGCDWGSGMQPQIGLHRPQCVRPQVLGGGAHRDQRPASLLSVVTSRRSWCQCPAGRGPWRQPRESTGKESSGVEAIIQWRG